MKAISVIIPVYMEADNIKTAVCNVIWALTKAEIDNYELIIIDCLRQDGTHDGTPEIAESLAKKNGRIRVLHNSYINLGKKYWIGVDAAKFPYVILVPGDGELAKEALRDILTHLGEADILISYPINTKIRPLMRRILSRTYIFLINLSTGLNLHYYNGSCVHRTDIMRGIKDRNDNLVYMAKLLVQLIKQGYSYREIPILLQERKGGKPSVLTIGNFLSVGRSIFDLFWKYKILAKSVSKKSLS